MSTSRHESASATFVVVTRDVEYTELYSCRNEEVDSHNKYRIVGGECMKRIEHVKGVQAVCKDGESARLRGT